MTALRFKLRFTVHHCIFITICCQWSATGCAGNKDGDVQVIIPNEMRTLGKVWLGFLSGLAEN